MWRYWTDSPSLKSKVTWLDFSSCCSSGCSSVSFALSLVKSIPCSGTRTCPFCWLSCELVGCERSGYYGRFRMSFCCRIVEHSGMWYKYSCFPLSSLPLNKQWVAQGRKSILVDIWYIWMMFLATQMWKVTWMDTSGEIAQKWGKHKARTFTIVRKKKIIEPCLDCRGFSKITWPREKPDSQTHACVGVW